MSSNCSVLVVCHYYPPHVGGIEVVAQQQARGLAAAGLVVDVLTCDGDAPAGSSQEAGVRVRRVRSWKRLERYGVPFPVCAPTLVWHALRAVRRADLVHVHDALYLTSWVTAVVCRLLRRPYVLSRHVGVVHHPSRLVRLVQGAINRTIGAVVARGASMVLPIDAYVASYARAVTRPATPVWVLPNAVDVRVFRPCTNMEERRRIRRHLELPLDEPLVLFVGRPVPKKGYHVVEAAASNRYGLVFVGGSRAPRTDGAKAFHLGQLQPAEVALAYRACDVFVGASVGEAPLTVREAMASGLPVLLNDDPAYRALGLPEGTALYQPMTPDVLRTALEELLSNELLVAARGRANRSYAERSFGWETHVERLLAAYRAVLSRKPPHHGQVPAS